MRLPDTIVTTYLDIHVKNTSYARLSHHHRYFSSRLSVLCFALKRKEGGFLFNILVDTDINNRRVKTTKIEMNE